MKIDATLLVNLIDNYMSWGFFEAISIKIIGSSDAYLVTYGI